MKKVIISGVTGQDGSYMVDYLLANTDHLIYGLVRRTANPNTRNISHNLDNPRFQLVTADLSDYQSIESAVQEIQPDYFINLAAQSFVGASWQIPEQTFDVVALGVLRCLEAIRKHAPHCRFYSAGSSEEMGDVQYSPQDMNHPIRPRSPYGAAKAAARHLTKVYRESYGLYAIHGMLYNHESERRGEEFVTRKIAKGVARIARAIKDGKEFVALELGNLNAKRDYSHALDFVDGIWRMLNQTPFLNGKPHSMTDDEFVESCLKNRLWWPSEYLLASGETHSVRSLVEKAFEEAGIRGEWNGDGVNETHTLIGTRDDLGIAQSNVLVKVNPAFYRPADVQTLLGDSSKARQELGWSPQVTFDQLVERMVKSELKEVGL